MHSVNGAVLSVTMEQMADDNGISYKTFKRAKEALGVISVKRGGQWYWEIPIEVVYTDVTEEGQNTEGGQAANALVPLNFYATES